MKISWLECVIYAAALVMGLAVQEAAFAQSTGPCSKCCGIKFTRDGTRWDPACSFELCAFRECSSSGGACMEQGYEIDCGGGAYAQYSDKCGHTWALKCPADLNNSGYCEYGCSAGS